MKRKKELRYEINLFVGVLRRQGIRGRLVANIGDNFYAELLAYGLIKREHGGEYVLSSFGDMIWIRS